MPIVRLSPDDIACDPDSRQGREEQNFVASGGGKYEKETVSKLKFDLNPTVTSERDRDGRHYV